MRRIALPATIVCLLALVPAAGARTPDCRTTGHTVGSNSKVRVYRVSNDAGFDYFACAYGHAGRRYLGLEQVWSSGSGYVEHIHLRGRFLAYAYVGCTDDCAWDAFAVDMRTRKAVRKASGRGGVWDLLMTRTRSLGLLTDLSVPYYGIYHYRVLKVDSDGRTLLDQGSKISPRSLAVSRHRVYWTRDGKPQSAHID